MNSLRMVSTAMALAMMTLLSGEVGASCPSSAPRSCSAGWCCPYGEGNRIDVCCNDNPQSSGCTSNGICSTTTTTVTTTTTNTKTTTTAQDICSQASYSDGCTLYACVGTSDGKVYYQTGELYKPHFLQSKRGEEAETGRQSVPEPSSTIAVTGANQPRAATVVVQPAGEQAKPEDANDPSEDETLEPWQTGGYLDIDAGFINTSNDKADGGKGVTSWLLGMKLGFRGDDHLMIGVATHIFPVSSTTYAIELPSLYIGSRKSHKGGESYGALQYARMAFSDRSQSITSASNSINSYGLRCGWAWGTGGSYWAIETALTINSSFANLSLYLVLGI